MWHKRPPGLERELIQNVVVKSHCDLTKQVFGHNNLTWMASWKKGYFGQTWLAWMRHSAAMRQFYFSNNSSGSFPKMVSPNFFFPMVFLWSLGHTWIVSFGGVSKCTCYFGAYSVHAVLTGTSPRDNLFPLCLLQVSLPALLRRRPPAVRPLGVQHRGSPSARPQEGQDGHPQRGGVALRRRPDARENLWSCTPEPADVRVTPL